MLPGIVADELHLLWVVIDRFVYDHDVAFGCTVFKIRCGVHADVNHAFRDLFVQFFRNFFGRKVIPAALNGCIVINDARLGIVLGLRRLADHTDGSKNADCECSVEADNGEDYKGS